MATNKKQYRQGDVFLEEISNEEFERLKQEYVELEQPTVALGEATGHHHTFEGHVKVYASEMAKSGSAINAAGMIVEVETPSIIKHQEHAPIEVPSGKYIRKIQREYTPEAIRNVID